MAGTRLVCLLGATGTGKTEAALRLAEAFGGAVVNVDSRQVYKGLAVLTAQPTESEQARCPHFLYGDTPLSMAVTAGAYAKRARVVIGSIAERGLLPLLVGGTGLYFRAILGGLSPIPPTPPEVRATVAREWEETGPAAMHARLAAVDSQAAARIHPSDRQRVTRALEVWAATGRTMTSWHEAGDPDAPDYEMLKIGLTVPREVLAERLAARIEAMAAGGAVDEVRAALAKYPADAPGLSGIGGPEIIAYLTGQTSLEAAKAAWLANTKAYAKRQETWFRKEPDVNWLAPDDHAGMAALVGRWRAGGEA